MFVLIIINFILIIIVIMSTIITNFLLLHHMCSNLLKAARQLSGGRDGALNVVLSPPLSQPCIRFWRNRRVTRSRTQNISAPKKAEKGKGRNPKQGLKADYIALHLLRFSGRTNVTAIIITIFLFLQQFAQSLKAVVRWKQRWCCPQPCSVFSS